MAQAGGTLYAIRAEGTSLVKIGYTRGSIEKRLQNLQTGQPFPLQVIATLPVESDARHKEALLHAFLATERRRGEWFEMAFAEHDLAGLLDRAIQFVAEQEARNQAAQEAQQRRILDQDLDMKLFASRLKTARREARLTQTALAEWCGLNLPNLNALERGKADGIRAVTLVRLACMLEVSADFLLGLTDDPTPAARRRVRA